MYNNWLEKKNCLNQLLFSQFCVCHLCSILRPRCTSTDQSPRASHTLDWQLARSSLRCLCEKTQTTQTQRFNLMTVQMEMMYKQIIQAGFEEETDIANYHSLEIESSGDWFAASTTNSNKKRQQQHGHFLDKNNNKKCYHLWTTLTPSR